MSELFDDIDNASARLILQLQLEDSASITSSILSTQPGRRIAAAQQPGLMAVLIFEEDMQRNVAVLQDRQLAVTAALDVGPQRNRRRRRIGAPGIPSPLWKLVERFSAEC